MPVVPTSGTESIRVNGVSQRWVGIRSRPHPTQTEKYARPPLTGDGSPAEQAAAPVQQVVGEAQAGRPLADTAP